MSAFDPKRTLNDQLQKWWSELVPPYGSGVLATVRVAEFLLFCNDGVRHPTPSWRAARKAGFPWSSQLALGHLSFRRSGSMSGLVPNAAVSRCRMKRRSQAKGETVGRLR